MVLSVITETAVTFVVLPGTPTIVSFKHFCNEFSLRYGYIGNHVQASDQTLFREYWFLEKSEQHEGGFSLQICKAKGVTPYYASCAPSAQAHSPCTLHFWPS